MMFDVSLLYNMNRRSIFVTEIELFCVWNHNFVTQFFEKWNLIMRGSIFAIYFIIFDVSFLLDILRCFVMYVLKNNDYTFETRLRNGN